MITNKKRLIDVDVTIRTFADIHSAHYDITYEGLIRVLKDAPTVDAVEVVHGRWNPIRNFGSGKCYGYCTNCKTPVKADNATGLVMNNRFCHWCGAKMDGGNVDG